MKIERRCPMCSKVTAINVVDEIVPMIELYNAGFGYIQDIPLPANEREFIKTGYCMKCQGILFGTGEE